MIVCVKLGPKNYTPIKACQKNQLHIGIIATSEINNKKFAMYVVFFFNFFTSDITSKIIPIKMLIGIPKIR